MKKETLKEKDIQKYLYENLEKINNFIWLDKLKENFSLIKEDLLFYPTKYLLYKKYHNIFDKMETFKESHYKFPIEFITAEHKKSKPRIDILAYNNDPSTFFIMEVKYWKTNNTEKQTITELMQYANWLQNNEFPWLSNDDIVFVVVAKHWSNMLIQSVINWVIFRNFNILPIIYDVDENQKINFNFFDLYQTSVTKNLDKELYNENNYNSLILWFDEKNRNSLNVENEDLQKITMLCAFDLSKSWKNWYVLWLENENWLQLRNWVMLLEFNPLLLETKNWNLFNNDKKELLYNFSNNYQFYSNSKVLKDNIKFYFLNKEISFEQWSNWNWLQNLQKRQYNYWYPFWFLEILIKDLIIFCKEDKIFSEIISNSHESLFNWYEEISHYNYLTILFEVYKSKANNIEDFYKYILLC